MKKIFLIIAALIIGTGVSAAAETQSLPRASTLDVLVHMDTAWEQVEARFTLYAADSDEAVAHAEVNTEGKTSDFTVHFDMPDYTPGTAFRLALEQGLSSVWYDYERIRPNEGTLTLVTGITEDGIILNYFDVTAIDDAEGEISITADSQPLVFDPQPRCVNGTLLVPVAGLAYQIGLDYVNYDTEARRVDVGANGYNPSFYIAEDFYTLAGYKEPATARTRIIDGVVYVPLADIASAFGFSVVTTENTDALLKTELHNTPLTSAGRGFIADAKTAAVMNSRGIASQTPYLIWVSKPEFRLRVYVGEKGAWKFVKGITCAIGAPSTPTCTGEFRYYSRESSWKYSSYYVGPIMRFNGGYAIHSTLLRYNGVPYDNRVGVQISHGCVRVRPEELNWLVNMVPLYTKVYITN